MKHSHLRKIEPNYKTVFKPDGTPNLNDRVEIGPTQLAFDEWSKASIEIPNLKVMSCLLYTSPSPRDRQKSRMPSSA